MDRLDETLPLCNGHCCEEPGDARTSQKTCSQKAATIPGDRMKGGFDGDCSQRRRRLVLHVDVRNTILVSDSATGDDVEQALNSFLTSVTWGREEPRGWVWYSDRPSLHAPCPGVITYYKSRERELVRSPTDRVRLRCITGDFTGQPIGRRFRKHFETHLRLLEWKFTQSPDVIVNCGCDVIGTKLSSAHDVSATTKSTAISIDRKLTIVSGEGRLYHYLLPSFIKMLYDLQADDRRFSVILRTYGVDAPRVLDSIAHIATGNHPLFPQKLHIDVNGKPGRIHRNIDGTIHCELPQTADGVDVPVVLETDADIYRFMSDVEGICGFVDDFKFWQEHSYAHRDGKPLWIDLADPDVHHIFFDDNIRVADSDSIVDVRFIEGGCSSCSRTVARSLSIDEIALLENVCVVQADLLESMSCVDYFINKVKQCEVNYSAWLRQHQTSKRHCHGAASALCESLRFH